MKLVRQALAVCLAVLVVVPQAAAQNHTIGKNALDQAVQQRVSRDQADRAAIVSVLHRAEVRQVAARAGLPIEKAEAAVGTLQGDQLQQLAGQARQIDNQLSGGSSTIVISTTTIIIVLLIVILIVVLAN